MAGPDDYICTNCDNEDQDEFVMDEESGLVECCACGWSDCVMKRHESDAVDRLIFERDRKLEELREKLKMENDDGNHDE